MEKGKPADLTKDKAMSYYSVIANLPSMNNLPRPYHKLEDCHVGWLLHHANLPKHRLREFWPADSAATGDVNPHRIQFGRPYPMQDNDGQWFSVAEQEIKNSPSQHSTREVFPLIDRIQDRHRQWIDGPAQPLIPEEPLYVQKAAEAANNPIGRVGAGVAACSVA